MIWADMAEQMARKNISLACEYLIWTSDSQKIDLVHFLKRRTTQLPAGLRLGPILRYSHLSICICHTFLTPLAIYNIMGAILNSKCKFQHTKNMHETDDAGNMQLLPA